MNPSPPHPPIDPSKPSAADLHRALDYLNAVVADSNGITALQTVRQVLANQITQITLTTREHEERDKDLHVMTRQGRVIEELREKLRVAEAVRDDARAASARDLAQRRETRAIVEAAVLTDQPSARVPTMGVIVQPHVVAAFKKNTENAVIPGWTASADHTPRKIYNWSERRSLVSHLRTIAAIGGPDYEAVGQDLKEAANALEAIDSDVARRNALEAAWKRGVSESVDKLTAFQASVGGLTYDKAIELLNKLLESPPEGLP